LKGRKESGGKERVWSKSLPLPRGELGPLRFLPSHRHDLNRKSLPNFTRLSLSLPPTVLHPRSLDRSPSLPRSKLPGSHPFALPSPLDLAFPSSLALFAPHEGLPIGRDGFWRSREISLDCDDGSWYCSRSVERGIQLLSRLDLIAFPPSLPFLLSSEGSDPSSLTCFVLFFHSIPHSLQTHMIQQ